MGTRFPLRWAAYVSLPVLLGGALLWLLQSITWATLPLRAERVRLGMSRREALAILGYPVQAADSTRGSYANVYINQDEWLYVQYRMAGPPDGREAPEDQVSFIKCSTNAPRSLWRLRRTIEKICHPFGHWSDEWSLPPQ